MVLARYTLCGASVGKMTPCMRHRFASAYLLVSSGMSWRVAESCLASQWDLAASCAASQVRVHVPH